MTKYELAEKVGISPSMLAIEDKLARLVPKYVRDGGPPRRDYNAADLKKIVASRKSRGLETPPAVARGPRRK